MSLVTLRGFEELFHCIFRGDPERFTQLFSPELANLLDEQKRSLLHAASHYGDISVVQILVWVGARVNAKDNRWLTPLHRACASGFVEIVKVLLDHGADQNARDKSWQTPLHVASANGHLECVRLLSPEAIGGSCSPVVTTDGPTHAADYALPNVKLTSTVNVNASDRSGHTALHHAVFAGHTTVVKLLLENGASVNAFDKFDRRSMHWAAFSGKVDIVELLCRFGAEATCHDKDHYTPLHVAAAVGSLDVATCLVKRGADLTACTARGNTPLHIACLNGHASVALVLLNAIADQDKPVACLPARDHSLAERRLSDAEGEHAGAEQTILKSSLISASIGHISEVDELSPLHLAVVSTNGANCLQLLLDALKDATSDMPSPSGWVEIHKAGGEYNSPALHLAALHGRCDRAKLLLSHGAEVNARDRLGNTALHIAADRGHEPLVVLLLQTISDGDNAAVWLLRGQAGSNPLHRAAMSGFAGCLSRLIKASLTDLLVRTEPVDGSGFQLGQLELDSDSFANFLSSASPLARLVQRRLSEVITECVDDEGRQLLHAAALGADLDCLRLVLLLIAASANKLSSSLLSRDRLGRSVLHYAVASCGMRAHHLLPLASGAIGDDTHSRRCVSSSHVDSASNVILLLIRLGADVKAADHFGCTPLHLACAFDHTGNLVKLLLDQGADPFAITSNWPPVKTIIKDQQQSSTSSQTDAEEEEVANSHLRCLPIHVAVGVGNLPATARLLESVALVADSQQTLAAYFCYGGPLCTSSGAEKNRSATEPLLPTAPSPCLLASLRGYQDILKLLLDALGAGTACVESSRQLDTTTTAKADAERLRHQGLCHLADGVGHTALHLAAHAGHAGVCRLLLEHETRVGNSWQLLAGVDAVYQWTALHHASAQGHCDVVRVLLQHADENCHLDGVCQTNLRDIVDEHGRTAIMLAAQYNHTSVLLQLLSVSVSQASGPQTPSAAINAVDVYGRTAHHRAVANGHVECTQLLLQHGADAGQVDFRKRHALHMAAASGQVSTLTLLLDHVIATSPDAAVETVATAVVPLDESAFSPLHFAAYRGHIDCVQRLLALSAYRTLAKSNAYTPLHCAVQNGHTDCLSLLLNHFGEDDIMTRDADDRTVIHVAALCNQTSCLSAIVKHCLEGQAAGQEGGGVYLATLLAQPDRLGRTGLMLAAGSGSADCFFRLLQLHRQLLLAQCGDADSDVSCRLSLAAQDQQGRSILHHFACGLSSRHDEEKLAIRCSTALLAMQSLTRDELSSLIGLRDSAGRTPLHVATISGLPRVVELLLAVGADVYAVDKEGCIPALSSAPTPSVAACLSLIMVAMFPPPRQRPSPARDGSSPYLDEGLSGWPTGATSDRLHRTHSVGRPNSFPNAWRPTLSPAASGPHSAPVECTADAREAVQVVAKTPGDSQPFTNEAEFY